MIRDALGDRMKHNYEEVSKTRLTRRMPVIIRLDGCHFHTFTRGFKKPFDEIMISSMQDTMKYLCENIQGCVLGYTQSDEITLILQDYKELGTDAWFDYEIQKMCSVAASMATLAFNRAFDKNLNEAIRKKTIELGRFGKAAEAQEYYLAHIKAIQKGATFDARCFNIPKEEVTNCILWRQMDAERNSINSLAQSLYSHKELQGLGVKEVKAKMDAEKGVIWGELPTTLKRGSCCIRENQLLNHKLLKTVFPRILQLEVGDLPKDKVAEMIKNLKEKIESKQYNIESLKDYENPGPTIENTVYLPTHEGDVDVILSTITDLGKWVIDDEIPRFTEDRDYIEELINFEEVKRDGKNSN